MASCRSPGCVHTDLLKNNLIEDPFYRTNEKKLQWIDKVDWEYQTTFSIDQEFLESQNIALLFKGLDTYADVFLNEQKILSADNMFREWRVNCKTILKPGENSLRILFHSPINTDLPKLEKLGYPLPAINDQSENGELGDKKVSIFARKAPYHYGWDWGPRFVTSGIWRPVVLRAWNYADIHNVQFIQNDVSKDVAAITAKMEINSNIDGEALLNIFSNETGQLVSKKVALRKGLNDVSVFMEINNPVLWWSNGLGAPHLYTIETSLSYNDKIVSGVNSQIGLRKIEVVREKDSAGTSFYFKLNGKPVFMKGANYIPSDIFLPRVTAADYENIIKSAADANMNMLRVWGGGIYENDVFYNLCDKYGILLWQDFMFACSMYPGDQYFLNNVKQEVIDNVVRLRNHPSIALWCGNNEMIDAWNNWGWKPLYTKDQQKSIFNAYKELFYNIIPGVVNEYDGTRYYWPSSPGSEYTKTSALQAGDFHYWGVWHGEEPFENFQSKIGRFVSEYGFQSFPEFKTVKSYTTPDDWNIESEVMMSHQRSGIGNLRIRDYLNMYYKTPKDFQSFLYVGQVLQAYGIKQAIEAHRRNMPYCMGTLYWQIDDCWPVASWSGMDYYKRWKALHYIAKKAYEPIISVPVIDNDNINFYIISDKQLPINATFRVKVMNFDGGELYRITEPVTIEANKSKSYLLISKRSLIGSNNPDKLVMVTQLTNNNEVLSENLTYFEQPKDLALDKPQIKVIIDRNEDGYSIELITDKLAKDVYLSLEENGFFSDNYFDLLPGVIKKISLKTDKEIDKDKIKIISLVDSY